MKDAIADPSQFGYNTGTETVFLIAVDQSKSPQQFTCKGSTMLKVILLLAVLIPAFALIRGAVQNGHKETFSGGDIYNCSSHEEYFPLKKNTCTGSTWTYLVLAISWPQTFCLEIGQTHCKIPENVNSWVLHGLWPSCNNTEGPESCNRSAVFDSSLVKDLLNDMNKYWPNLRTNEGYYSFWTHEWCKHGTCASSLPSLDGEHTYFTETLQLFQEYNPYSVLEEAGITPSDNKMYSAQNVSSAIQQKYSVVPFVGCIKDNDVYYLREIYLCMDKKFNLMNCSIPAKEYCKQDKMIYPTIKHA